MKIAVLSDTHARRISQLPQSLVSALIYADLIVHLGDYDTRELVDELRNLGKFRGVTGNHDFAEIRAVLPDTDILEINGRKLGLIHGHGCTLPFGLRNGLKARFKGENVDAILYGHTHVVMNKVAGGTLFFNPGSAAGRFPAYKRSFGIITVGESIIHGALLRITEPGSIKVSSQSRISVRESTTRKLLASTYCYLGIPKLKEMIWRP